MIRPTGLTAIRQPDAPLDGWYAVIAITDGTSMEFFETVPVELGPSGNVYLLDHSWHSRLAALDGVALDGEPAVVGLFHRSYFPEELNAGWCQ